MVDPTWQKESQVAFLYTLLCWKLPYVCRAQVLEEAGGWVLYLCKASCGEWKVGISGQRKYVVWEQQWAGEVPFRVPQHCEIGMSMKNHNPCSSHPPVCIASWWEGIAAMQLLGNCLKAYSHVRIKAVAVCTSLCENFGGCMTLGEDTSSRLPWQRDPCCQCCGLK